MSDGVDTNVVVFKYLGDGSESLPGVPARDLTLDDYEALESWEYEEGHPREGEKYGARHELLAHVRDEGGLYEQVMKLGPARSERKRLRDEADAAVEAARQADEQRGAEEAAEAATAATGARGRGRAGSDDDTAPTAEPEATSEQADTGGTPPG